MPQRLGFTLRVRGGMGAYELTPAELPGLDLVEMGAGRGAADANSFVLVRCDPLTARTVQYDPARSGIEAGRVPHRFEADYGGRALPLAPRRGKLVFPAPSEAGTYLYHLYYDLRRGPVQAPEWTGVIGDGDALLQTGGELCASGKAQPVEYGGRLFGRRGLLIGVGYGGAWFLENRARENERPLFVNWGALKDTQGQDILGTPVLADWDGDGLLHLVCGDADGGGLFLYRNTGSNENPAFAPREPLLHEDNTPLDLLLYLKDIEVPNLRWDDTVNPIYPSNKLVKVHGGKVHLSACPQYVDWSGQGKAALMVATQGGFLLHFARVGERFRRGAWVRDEAGERIRPGASIQVADWNGDGQHDLIAGDVLGYCSLWERIGVRAGVPVLRNRGRITPAGQVLREDAHAHPCLICWDDGRRALLVGNHRGEIHHFPVLREEGGQPLFDASEPVGMRQAPLLKNMAACHYVDLNGDGVSDLVAGDIAGGLYYYRNAGTDKNPAFERCRPLHDTDGPIKIVGGPDPNMTTDGYSKPSPCDLTGDGRTDLVTGTGLGKIYYFRNLGPDAEGHPRFARGKVLRDEKGRLIRNHLMSSVCAGDWDDDGVTDLLVGGQPNVHAHPDDDPDTDCWVRFYRGRGRQPDGVLAFTPYQGFECRGDRQIAGRPKPIIGTWDGEKVLFVGPAIFRRRPGGKPEQLEFVASLPPRRAHARHDILTADYTFSAMGADDPLLVQATCISRIHMFRMSFLRLRGYLDVSARLANIEHRNAGAAVKVSRHIRAAPQRLPCPPRRAAPQRYDVLRVEEDTGPDSPLWKDLPIHGDFVLQSMMNRCPIPPADRAAALQLAWHAGGLLLRLRCHEPAMERLIAQAPMDQAAIIMSDDHAGIAIGPGSAPSTGIVWIVNARGRLREVGHDLETGVEAPLPASWAGRGPFVHVRDDARGWTLFLHLPWERFGAAGRPGAQFRLNVWRNRSLYANAIRASEQREAERMDWTGAAANLYGGALLTLSRMALR